MSFHSTHATSHALQPMQVVTSMYLQTSSSRWTPAPGTLPEWPEMALIWSVPVAMINFFFLLAGPHPRSLSLGGPASPGFPPAPRSGRRRSRPASRFLLAPGGSRQPNLLRVIVSVLRVDVEPALRRVATMLGVSPLARPVGFSHPFEELRRSPTRRFERVERRFDR